MKILLIQHRQIGDVLMCTPAIRALRKHLPEADITFAVEPFSYNALKYNPHINHFIIPPKKLGPGKFIALHWKAWRAKYDAVVDFFRGPKATWLTWFTRSPKRISFTGRHRRFGYNIEIEGGDKQVTYAAIQKLRLLKPLGIEEEKDCVPEFFITEEERAWADKLWQDLGIGPDELTVTISPVSRKQYRVWPPEYYSRLCDHLIREHKAKVILTWGPGEENFIQPIVKGMQEEPITDYPMPTLLQLQAVLEKTSLLIGNNNGPRHMCIAAGTPSLGLFSKLPPAHWTPPDHPLHTVIQPDPAKDENGNEVLLARNLPPEKAIAAADEKIAGLGK
ncbi:glycosyltransferase family 9 protein [Planctomycetota bacterium]